MKASTVPAAEDNNQYTCPKIQVRLNVISTGHLGMNYYDSRIRPIVDYIESG